MSALSHLDLTGKVFGYLTVKHRLSLKRPVWCCVCRCGKTITPTVYELLNETTKSCGCKRKENGRLFFVDISGKTFGKLTALKPIKTRRGRDRIKWLCRCSCGKLCKTTGGHLRSGHTRSCGCLSRERIKDISGITVGYLKVELRKNGKWRCKCHCGKTVCLSRDNLRKKISCGCMRKKGIRCRHDISNQIFGRLTVIKPHGKQWLCDCTCGQKAVVSISHLRSGHTQSCGCLQLERTRVNLEGKIFGRLKVVRHAGLRKSVSGFVRTLWLCTCACGNTTTVNAASLISGATRSCGCLLRESTRMRSQQPHVALHNRMMMQTYWMRRKGELPLSQPSLHRPRNLVPVSLAELLAKLRRPLLLTRLLGDNPACTDTELAHGHVG